jgi:hypothetical protein
MSDTTFPALVGTDVNAAGGTFAAEYSFEFDGTGDYFDLGTPSALDLAGDMSISLWINTSVVDGTLRFVAGQSNAGAGNYQWFIDINRSQTQSYFALLQTLEFHQLHLCLSIVKYSYLQLNLTR